MLEGQSRTLNVVLTMDVLPAVRREEVHGPERWDEAERAVEAFAEAVDTEGLEATFFVCPEALERLESTLRDVAGAGELGMLCHPQLQGYQSYLGSYSFDRQEEILELHTKMWQDRMGEHPLTFRPGFFSANDYTYHVVCMKGYRQGSCSLPGRMDNDQCSLWYPTYPFPHHTDPLDRTQAGTMEFYEVPVTSDFEAADHVSYETYTPPHLRIEETDLHEYAGDLVRHQLTRMQEDRARVRAATLVTSNVAGWGGSEDPHVERLHNIRGMLKEVAEEREMELQPNTVAGLHERADEIHRHLKELEEEQQ